MQPHLLRHIGIAKISPEQSSYFGECFHGKIRLLLERGSLVAVMEMSTVQQIEAAIRSLAPAEREELIKDLPGLLPELDGDAAWEQITRDSRPRAGFTALLNEVQTEYQKDPKIFPVIKESDFDQRP
jgi:hypothetical protein